MKVALYCRVSTEEQAQHGISIDAQLAALRAWAKDGGHIIIGEYIDAGISARKPATKRPELQRLLNELPIKHPDVIVFCKLDRWFRSVKEYYKVQEILDTNKVAWQAIQEDYDTVTASGRFKVNIMLAVAEDEADRTSERIKAVFEHKVDKGEAITGKIPLGYKIENKRLVPDENADAARAVFNRFAETGSLMNTVKMLENDYGIKTYQSVIKKMLRNKIYIGKYRDNFEYCEPLISNEQFQIVETMLKGRSIRSNQTGRVYIFSGLLKCGNCGRRMSAARSHKQNVEYIYYRCNNAIQYHRCTNHKCINENDLEKWLLENAATELDSWQRNWEAEHAKTKRPKIDAAAIERKLDRLKDLYVDELITKEQYKADREKYLEQLTQANEPEEPIPDFDAIKQQLSGDFHSIYENLERPEKRNFWRKILSEIRINEDKSMQIIFI